jgi:hypothetical protein
MTAPTAYQPPPLPNYDRCPECGRTVAINRQTAALRPHGPHNGCPGSNMPGTILTLQDRESWRTGDVYELLDRYRLTADRRFEPRPNMDPDDELKMLISHNRRIVLDAVAYVREHDSAECAGR